MNCCKGVKTVQETEIHLSGTYPKVYNCGIGQIDKHTNSLGQPHFYCFGEDIHLLHVCSRITISKLSSTTFPLPSILYCLLLHSSSEDLITTGLIFYRSVQKVSSHILWKIEKFMDEDTRYKKHCTWDNDASVPFIVGPWDLTQFSQSPSAALSYFPESHRQSEISSLSNVIVVLGKARSCRVQNLGCRGAESPRWFDISQTNSAGDMIYEWACCHDEDANHQLPIALAFWIIWIVLQRNGQA